MHRRTVVAVAVSAAIGSVMAAGGLSAGAARAAASEPMTPTASSTLFDRITPLVGSPSTLVYSSVHKLAVGAGGYFDAASLGYDGAQELTARTASGHTVSLGRLSGLHIGWSIVGDTVTAERAVFEDEDDLAPTPTGIVDWWDVASGQRGSVLLSTGDQYESAGPDGLVYKTATGVLRLRTTDGPVSTLSHPFSDGYIYSVAAGDEGLVVIGLHQAAYLPFAHPATPVTLDAGTSTSVRCRVVTTSYAGCNDVLGPMEGGDLVRSAILVPLNGSAPTISTQCPGLAAVFGDTMMWNADCIGAGEHTVYAIGAGDSTVKSAAVNVEGPLVTAFDRAVGSEPPRNYPASGAVEASQSTIVAFTSPTSTSTAVAPTPSTVSAAAFAVSAGRLVYNDDQPSSAVPAARVSTMSRTLTASPTTLTASSAKSVAAGTGTHKVLPGLAGASAGAVVYADNYRRDPATDGELSDWHVVSAHGTATIPDAPAGTVIAISGNRVIYPSRSGSAMNLYDVRTGRTTNLHTLGVPADSYATAIWGNYVAWATPHGWVYRLDLKTGQKVKLRTGDKKKTYGDFSVYLYGDWVGWHSQSHSTPSKGDVNAIRNARTMKPATHLSRTLYSLTSAGALLDSAVTQKLGASGSTFHQSTSFSLRTYAGHTSTLISERRFVTGPQLDGNALAWVDSAGVLRAKAVSVPVARPWSLGDSQAPARFAATGSSTWTLSTPYSLGLKTCQVIIARHGATVRKLSCAKASLASGVVTATWDSQTSKGSKAAAGTYTWTIHATGASGAVLNSAGGSAHVGGTVTLTR